MRETRVAQASIFENYSEHEFGERLKALSAVLDEYPEILTLVERDLIDKSLQPVGRNGLTVETIFRSLLLKQQLRVSYEQLAFHLSDSMSYRTFVRLPGHMNPKKSALQATIRCIKPETLEMVHQLLSKRWIDNKTVSMEKLRLDSTVVKSNIAPPSDRSGFITYLSIEEGNPSDKELFLPVLDAHQEKYDCLPHSVVADGGYASQENVSQGRELGIKRVVFHKRVGIAYHAMGVKIKTFKRLRNFRAGIEGNISELKRAFGASKAIWKGHEGFKAYVWSSVISYNLVRLARMQSG